MERRRGRPPHPDILTPREWEVLELLRQSLTNEEIAQRLDISVPGVKYHVSEILSKLHVSSREEAASWQPEEQTPSVWRRALAIPLIGARAGSIAIVSAAIIGIGVLVWAFVSVGGTDDTPAVANPPDPSTSLHLDVSPAPTSQASPAADREIVGTSYLTANQAIVYATHFSEAENLSAVEATLMTYAEARELTGTSTVIPGEPPGDSPTWLIAFTGRFFTASLGDFEQTIPPPGDPPCTIEYIYLIEEPLTPVRSAVRSDGCQISGPISRETAIARAARVGKVGLRYQVPQSASAELVTAGEVYALLAERWPLFDGVTALTNPSWLVHITGFTVPRHTVGDSGSTSDEEPTPKATLQPAPTTISYPAPYPTACAEMLVILTADGDSVIVRHDASDACPPNATD